MALNLFNNNDYTNMVNAASSSDGSSSNSIGFNFDNATRNAYLAANPMRGFGLPKATSTGTTIVGCIYAGDPNNLQDKGGVVLGADTRATEGSIVADKNCEKIHYISDNIMCCGAGTAADTEFTTAEIRSQIALHQLNTGREPRVVTAMTMLKQKLFQYQGQIGAALVLGGCDVTGPHLFTIAPHGSTDKLPYVTMGSGSLAAMAVFESRWTPKLTREDAIKMVVDAISAGIFNDLGSGSNVDVCIISKNKNEMLRNYVRPNERVAKELSYRFRNGTTSVKKIEVRKFVVAEEVIHLVKDTKGDALPAVSEMQVDA